MRTKQLKAHSEHINGLTDEEIIMLIHQGSGQALDYLIHKYKNFVRAKSRAYFLIGADREDIIQEGMIGLYKAIRDYDGKKLASFRGFAELCITRQMITAIKSATRKKHTPLNSSISLDKPIYDEESERTLLDIIAGQAATDPQDLLVKREKQGYVQLKIMESLSDLERKVLHLYLDGKTYEEISVELKRHVKSIDNALQRVKRKLEQFNDTNEILLSFIEYEDY
ncbi:RNA polymerase sporulation sigma factor SigH [Cerasibacillus terrae]|uniref:RNA polymerase sporulation sigma factor SigH n=1 Tax=Cerasibacillus terrae TaxID=2498845 RepID=A0A5C8NJL1_9BACI|nr:RNA polymerase sporulation sigma factor SigH [Cerasibacillus terrae]TXL61035.1 RNA polymerase sporulation sigma factor SigH [Cerasibacillus terrae]